MSGIMSHELQQSKQFDVCLQSGTLQDRQEQKLSATLKQENANTLAAANNSLTVLRIRQAQRLVQQRSQ